MRAFCEIREYEESGSVFIMLSLSDERFCLISPIESFSPHYADWVEDLATSAIPHYELKEFAHLTSELMFRIYERLN
jgi:hypothetical protein